MSDDHTQNIDVPTDTSTAKDELKTLFTDLFVTDLRGDLAGVKGEVKGVINELRQIKGRLNVVTDLKSLAMTQQEDLVEANKKLGAVSTKLGTVDGLLSGQTTALAGLESALTAVVEKMEGLAELAERIQRQQAAMPEVANNVADLSTKLGTVEVSLSGHTKALKGLESGLTDLAELAEAIQQQQAAMPEVANNVADLSIKLGTVEVSLSGHTKALKGLESGLTDLAELAEAIQQQQAAMPQVPNTVDAPAPISTDDAPKEWVGLRDSLSALQQKVATCESGITSLLTREPNRASAVPTDQELDAIKPGPNKSTLMFIAGLVVGVVAALGLMNLLGG